LLVDKGSLAIVVSKYNKRSILIRYLTYQAAKIGSYEVSKY